MLETFAAAIFLEVQEALQPNGYEVLDARPDSTELAAKKIFVFVEELETPQGYADGCQSVQLTCTLYVMTCFDPRGSSLEVARRRIDVLAALTRAIPVVTAAGATMTLNGDVLADAEGVTVASAPVTLEWSESV